MKKYLFGILGLICANTGIFTIIQLNIAIRNAYNNVQIPNTEIIVISSTKPKFLIFGLTIIGALFSGFQIKRNTKLGIIALVINIIIISLFFYLFQYLNTKP